MKYYQKHIIKSEREQKLQWHPVNCQKNVSHIGCLWHAIYWFPDTAGLAGHEASSERLPGSSKSDGFNSFPFFSMFHYASMILPPIADIAIHSWHSWHSWHDDCRWFPILAHCFGWSQSGWWSKAAASSLIARACRVHTFLTWLRGVGSGVYHSRRVLELGSSSVEVTSWTCTACEL